MVLSSARGEFFLAAAGVGADIRVYPAAPHAFTGHETPMAQAALDDIGEWIEARLEG